MSSLGEDNRLKRGPSSPLSENEETDNHVSRRSRIKRINLTENLTEGKCLTSIDENGGQNLTAVTTGQPTRDHTEEDGTEIAPPPQTTKTPVTLESMSGKIDQILGYLVTNKNELSAINNRHEKRFKILEDAHNEVADRFDQVTYDIASNATEIARNSTNIESNEACISTLQTQLRICKAANEEYICKLKDLDLEMKNLKSEFAENKREVLDLGLEVRDRRLSLSGVVEQDDEDPISVALTAVNKILTHALSQSKSAAKITAARPKLRTLKLVDIDSAHRIGKKQRKKGNRTLIITFSFTHIRQMVLSAKQHMKNLGVKYYLNEDLTQVAKDFRSNLKVIAEGGKSLGHDTKITGNKLIIDSETYQADEINAVSPSILHAAKRERVLKDGIAFRGDRSIFSNFFPSPFTIDDVDYANAEQYFQHEKALQCGDEKQARKIMNKSNPWYIKIAGSRVELKEEWKKNRLRTLYNGIYAKFEQNIPLRQALLNTMGLNLYEATTDLFYACGIDLDSPKWDTGNWPGQNITGQILMKVRSEFLAEESLTDSTSDSTLMNLTYTDDDPESTPMDTEDRPEPTISDAQTEDWPTVAQATGSLTDAVKLPTPSLGQEIAPKLSKSLPQVTRTPVKNNPVKHQYQEKAKSLFPREELSGEDLAFLNVSGKRKNNKKKGETVYNSSNIEQVSKKGKGKGKRRQSKVTSTPAKQLSDCADLTNVQNLSPSQLAAIKQMGFQPNSEYVKNIALSQAKHK